MCVGLGKAFSWFALTVLDLIYLHVCMCDQEKGGGGGSMLPPRVINQPDVLSPILTTQISSSFPPFYPQHKLVTPSSSET